MATDFATRFYQFLADGDPIGAAFDKVRAAVQFARGSDTRQLYDVTDRDARVFNRWPWNRYVRTGSEVALRWNLPDTADDLLFGLPSIPEKYYQGAST